MTDNPREPRPDEVPDPSQPYTPPAYGGQPSNLGGQQYAPPPYVPPPGVTPQGYAGYPVAGAGDRPPLATWGKRALGALLDFVVPGIIVNWLLSSLFRVDPGAVNWLANLGTLLIYLALAAYSAKTGQTWGRAVAKTQLVGDDGRPIGLGRSFLRYVLHIVDSLVLFLGWLWPLWDAKRQTLADKIMNTYVLDVSASGPVNVQR